MNFLTLGSQLRNPVAAILSVVLTSYLAFIHETGINPYIHQKLLGVLARVFSRSF